jgi:DNA repair photolyase
MIISASRRTDIPAFYSEWFMNRIREGFCAVPNPLNNKQVSIVSLRPDDVDILVFWSKNPSPLIKHLVELDEKGFSYYFQFTLNNYPRAFEPNVPSIERRLDVFKELSEHIGLHRVVWRYDPIIISNFTNNNFHIEQFAWIADELKESTQRVMISLVDFYKKTDRRLSQIEKEEGYIFEKDLVDNDSTIILIKNLAEIARRNNIEIFTCAEERDYSQYGVQPGKCIDNNIIQKINGKNIKYKKDPYQRESCLCMISKDIGLNDTCMHGCQYCYATTNNEMAKRRFSEHDPLAPALWGKMTEIPDNSKVEGQIKLF